MPNPFLSFEAALPGIIAEKPKTIMRSRETNTDTFKGPTVFTAGPFTVRIEPMGQGRSDTWDEKGNVARVLFQLVGHNIPRITQENGVLVPMFKLNDTVTDNEGNTYVVVAPQYVEGKMLQLTLALRG